MAYEGSRPFFTLALVRSTFKSMTFEFDSTIPLCNISWKFVDRNDTLVNLSIVLFLEPQITLLEKMSLYLPITVL